MISVSQTFSIVIHCLSLSLTLYSLLLYNYLQKTNCVYCINVPVLYLIMIKTKQSVTPQKYTNTHTSLRVYVCRTGLEKLANIWRKYCPSCSDPAHFTYMCLPVITSTVPAYIYCRQNSGNLKYKLLNKK